MPHFLSPLIASPAAPFRLQNGTTGLVIASHLEPAFTSSARRRGLLQRDGLDAATAIILAPCAAIHTFFMRFSIDVVFVAKDGTVAKVRARVKPWRIAMSFGAFAVIELAAGGTQTRVGVGDRLQLEVLP